MKRRSISWELVNKYTKLHCGIVALATAFVLNLTIGVPAFGAAITTGDGGGADVWISSGHGNKSFNPQCSDCFLEARHTKYGSRHTYLRWDLSELSGVVTNANMKIMVGFAQNSTVDVNMAVWGLNDGHAGEGWGETTTTWNNAPGNDTTTHSSGDITPHTVLIASQVTQLGTLTASSGIAAGDILTFSSAALDSFINADTDDQVTLILTNLDDPSLETSVQLMEKETPDTIVPSTGLTYAPTLDLPGMEIPEPTSFVLLGLGLVGLLTSRRRGTCQQA